MVEIVMEILQDVPIEPLLNNWNYTWSEMLGYMVLDLIPHRWDL